MTPDLERLCADIYNRIRSDPNALPRIMMAVSSGVQSVIESLSAQSGDNAFTMLAALCLADKNRLSVEAKNALSEKVADNIRARKSRAPVEQAFLDALETGLKAGKEMNK